MLKSDNTTRKISKTLNDFKLGLQMYRMNNKNGPVTKYDIIAPSLKINENRLILMYMPNRGTKMVLIDQEMYELWAPENEGRVLLQHKVCISVACEMIVIDYCCCFNKIWMWKIWKKIMLHKPITVLLLLFIFFIHMKKYVNCSICAFTLHITTNVQTLCWSKTSPSFSGAHSSCISRSINTTNRHVHQDQYGENGFHLSQYLVR